MLDEAACAAAWHRGVGVGRASGWGGVRVIGSRGAESWLCGRAGDGRFLAFTQAKEKHHDRTIEKSNRVFERPGTLPARTCATSNAFAQRAYGFLRAFPAAEDAVSPTRASLPHRARVDVPSVQPVPAVAGFRRRRSCRIWFGCLGGQAHARCVSPPRTRSLTRPEATCAIGRWLQCAIGTRAARSL
jgi:hypothetical protein